MGKTLKALLESLRSVFTPMSNGLQFQMSNSRAWIWWYQVNIAKELPKLMRPFDSIYRYFTLIQHIYTKYEDDSKILLNTNYMKDITIYEHWPLMIVSISNNKFHN